MPLAQNLRQSMQTAHDSIEQLPVSVAMAQGTVTREAYFELLVQLYYLHSGFEQLLNQHLGLHPLVTSDVFRVPAIQRDLQHFGFSLDQLPGVWSSTNELLEKLEAWGGSEPHRLLGTLYILEGSRMGSMFLSKPMARAMGAEIAPNQGLDYHIEGMAGRPATWMRWKQKLDGLPFTDSEQQQIITTACATMDGLHAIYEAVDVTVPATLDGALIA